jgi:hypothetical protein
LRHVTAAAEGGLEFFEGEKDFAVVIAGLIFRLDVNRADFPAVGAGI